MCFESVACEVKIQRFKIQKFSSVKRLLYPSIFLLPVAFIAFTPADKNADRSLQLAEVAGNYFTYTLYKTPKAQDVYTTRPSTGGTGLSQAGAAMDSMRFSNANATLSPHGQKLYKLYVKDIASYKKNNYAAKSLFFQPAGQSLVQETWDVRIIPNDSARFFKNAHQHPADKKWYLPVKAAQLFVMYKEAVSDTTNDGGWYYSVMDIAENGSSATIARQGLPSNCMGCHSSNRDKIFGPGKK